MFNKLADFSRPGPAETFVLLDECPDSINDGLFEVHMTSAIWGDVVGSMHCGNCGFSFADGHAEIHKWLDNNTKFGVVAEHVRARAKARLATIYGFSSTPLH